MFMKNSLKMRISGISNEIFLDFFLNKLSIKTFKIFLFSYYTKSTSKLNDEFKGKKKGKKKVINTP